MAVSSAAGPGGFSYAQAARGRQQTGMKSSSTDLATGDAPATSPDTVTGKEWTEDTESHARVKAQENGEDTQDTTISSEVKPSSVERMKLDNKMPSQSSGVSSPDMAASATSHDDVSSSAQNGTSLSSWEAKSQSSDTVVPSEPAWIAERKERQSTQKAETLKGGNTTIMPEQKPVALHEAPLPTVNPWARRAEEAKSKTAPAPPPQPRAVSAPTNMVRIQAQDDVKPRSDHEKSNTSNSRSESTPRNKQSDATTTNTRPAEAARPRNSRPENKITSSQPPPVKDETSWPTPETSQEIERKASQSHPAPEDKVDEEASSSKPREKTKWKPVPVVPNVIFETPNVRTPRAAPNGERPARGGASTRGRGGARGAFNTTSPTSHTDTAAASSHTDSGRPARHSSKERSAMPPPPLPSHAQGRTEHSRKARTPNGISPTEDTTAARTEQRDSSQHQPADSVKVDGTAVQKFAEHRRDASSLDNAFTASDSRHSEFASPVEARKDPRATDGKEANWAGRGFTHRRGGRGRGGAAHREGTNGHAFSYANGYDTSAQFSPGSPYGRGSYANYPNNYNRGTARGNSNRSQSIPDAMSPYPGIYVPPYMVPSYPSPLPNYGHYALGSPSLLHLPQEYVQAALDPTIQQLDYYFSVDNLATDQFLRQNMDSQGFVMVDVVMGFNRLKHITTDVEMIKVACLSSNVVDIRVGDDGKLRMRKTNDWQQWVLPEEDRVPDARTPGPKHTQSLNEGFGQFFSPQIPARHQHHSVPNIYRHADRRSYDLSYGTQHQMSPHAMFAPEFMQNGSGMEQSNGDDYRGRHMNAPVRANGSHEHRAASSTQSCPDTDAFSDDKIEQLMVCVKVGKDSLPQLTASSRTFSNGSLDAEAVDKQSEDTAVPTVNGDAHPESHDNASKSDAANENSLSEDLESQDVSVFWIKDGDKPSVSLPSNLTPMQYVQIRAKALEQRDLAATGNCPYDLIVLYQFWSHFLIRNFNNKMYSEFVSYAHQDAKERCNDVGHQNLIKYYDQALQSNNVVIPVRVANDYLALAKADTSKDAFRNLHRAWRDGALNIRSRKRLSDLVDAELRQLLEG